MLEIKPQIILHVERPLVRKDISTTFDIVVEINSSTDSQSVSFESKPCNLCLVIDRSGSMTGEKLDIAKQACLDIYKRLDFQKDRLSVVVFDDTAEVIFNPDTPREQFEEKIINIKTGGSTDIGSGWRLGLLEIQTHGSEEHINRVILLSDGQANQGETKKDVLARDSEQAYNLGITTSTIGIGKDFEEDILDAIATASCGNFWFVEQTSLETIIKTEFEGALSILHENPQVRLNLPTGVTIDKQLNKLRKATRSNVDFRLPPLWGGKRTCYAFRLNIDPKLFDSTENKFLNMGATLLDKGVEISSINQELKLGNEEDFVTVSQSSVVIEEVQRYQLATSEEKAIELIDAGDIEGLKNLVIEMREGLRVAQSKISDEIFKIPDDQSFEVEKGLAEQCKLRVNEEINQINQIGSWYATNESMLLEQESIESVISYLNKISEEKISKELQEKLKNQYSFLLRQIMGEQILKTRKIMHQRVNQRGIRNWVGEQDQNILDLTEKEMLASLKVVFEELFDVATDDSEIIRLQEKINDRLESLSSK